MAFQARRSGGSFSSNKPVPDVNDFANQMDFNGVSEVRQDWVKRNFEVTLDIVSSLQGQINGLDSKIKVIEKSSADMPSEIQELRDDVHQIQGLLDKLENTVSQRDLMNEGHQQQRHNDHQTIEQEQRRVEPITSNEFIYSQNDIYIDNPPDLSQREPQRDLSEQKPSAFSNQTTQQPRQRTPEDQSRKKNFSTLQKYDYSTKPHPRTNQLYERSQTTHNGPSTGGDHQEPQRPRESMQPRPPSRASQQNPTNMRSNQATEQGIQYSQIPSNSNRRTSPVTTQQRERSSSIERSSSSNQRQPMISTSSRPSISQHPRTTTPPKQQRSQQPSNQQVRNPHSQQRTSELQEIKASQLPGYFSKHLFDCLPVCLLARSSQGNLRQNESDQDKFTDRNFSFTPREEFIEERLAVVPISIIDHPKQSPARSEDISQPQSRDYISDEIAEIKRELSEITLIMQEELNNRPNRSEVQEFERQMKEQLDTLMARIDNNISDISSVSSQTKRSPSLRPLAQKVSKNSISCLSCNSSTEPYKAWNSMPMRATTAGKLGKYGVQLDRQRQKKMQSKESNKAAKSNTEDGKQVIIQVSSPCSFNFYHDQG